MPEEEFLGELAEKTTSVTIREFTPDGVRMTYNLQGTLKGQFDATTLETVDALLRPDGVYEFEVLGIDQSVAGDVLLVRGKGTGKMISPTSVHAEGEVTYQTMSKTLEWLNSAKGRFEGTYNQPTGEFVAKVFAQR
jgi:YD repeat-containing protein